MELGIGMAGKRHSNVVIILMNVVLTVLISDFIAFVIEWIRGGKLEVLSFFIVPTITGIVLGILFSLGRISIEKKIMETEKFWENIFHSSVSGIILTDLSGKIKYANDYALNFHGYTLCNISYLFFAPKILTNAGFTSIILPSGVDLYTPITAFSKRSLYFRSA